MNTPVAQSETTFESIFGIGTDTKWIPVDLGNQIVNIRKWKVRDRMMLRNALQEEHDEEKISQLTFKHLIEGCMDKPYPLNRDELEYIFIEIRRNSIGNLIDFDLMCPHCNTQSHQLINLENLYTCDKGKLQDIEIRGLKIEFQPVQNVKAYNKQLQNTFMSEMDDMIWHIKSINDNENFTYKQITEFFENLDTEMVDEILEEYRKGVFKITSRTQEFECPHCGKKTSKEFTDIPDLIPAEWYAR